MKFPAALLYLAAVASASSSPDVAFTDASPIVFQVTNFSVAAPYKSSMSYLMDVQYAPNPNFLARCLARTDTYAQCPNAAGVVPFARNECLGPNGTNPDPGRWYWQLNRAHVSSGDGFNFEVELHANDIPSIAKTYYGCKYFAAADVKCNNTVKSAKGPPAAYLDAPKSFTIVAQTTSGCAGDIITSTTTAKATATKA